MSNDKMPERRAYKEFNIETGEHTRAEYIRADLVPQWHDKPELPGTYLASSDVHGLIVVRVPKKSKTPRVKRRWFGPIPEDK